MINYLQSVQTSIVCCGEIDCRNMSCAEGDEMQPKIESVMYMESYHLMDLDVGRIITAKLKQ
jgi:hypothetical protein